MNIAFVIDDEIHTSPLTGSILDGITRKSILQISKDLGIKIHETPISIDTVIESIKSGNLTEIFGVGTAAAVAPVGHLKYKNTEYIVNNGEVGKISKQLYNQLLGIQYGSIEDIHGWIFPVTG